MYKKKGIKKQWHVNRREEKMKRGRQEEIIKQRKDTYGGVGGDREGKMTYLGYTACSGILHPLCPAHTLQVPSEVNPPAFPPLCAVTALLPLLQLVCMFARVCVCRHFFFPDIPVRSREAVGSAAERQD